MYVAAAAFVVDEVIGGSNVAHRPVFLGPQTSGSCCKRWYFLLQILKNPPHKTGIKVLRLNKCKKRYKPLLNAPS